MKDARLLVIGAGVNGSAIAARLSSAGADVAALAIGQILAEGVLPAA
jgi:glycine/D-amino acid oxidase-like deaminating enzyme